MKSLLERLKDGKVLVSDGAWGTFLQQLGLGVSDCPEIWNITHRHEVLSIAKSYIDAGSDIVLTNSFGGHPIKLAHFGLQDRAFEIKGIIESSITGADGNIEYLIYAQKNDN